MSKLSSPYWFFDGIERRLLINGVFAKWIAVSIGVRPDYDVCFRADGNMSEWDSVSILKARSLPAIETV